jgi:hypothetical protein
MISTSSSAKELLWGDTGGARARSPGIVRRPARARALRCSAIRSASAGVVRRSRDGTPADPGNRFARAWEAAWNARPLGRTFVRPSGVPFGFPCALPGTSWNAPDRAEAADPAQKRSIGFPLGSERNILDRRGGTSRAFAREGLFQSGSRTSKGKPQGTPRGLRRVRRADERSKLLPMPDPSGFPDLQPIREPRNDRASPERRTIAQARWNCPRQRPASDPVPSGQIPHLRNALSALHPAL